MSKRNSKVLKVNIKSVNKYASKYAEEVFTALAEEQVKLSQSQKQVAHSLLVHSVRYLDYFIANFVIIDCKVAVEA